MKSLLLNLFATKMPFSSNYYQLFSFPQISFFSVFEKHLMLLLVVLFAKSWSFVFPKFLLDVVQIPKLKLHYWENIKFTVIGPFTDWRVSRLTVPRRHIPTVQFSDCYQMFNFLKIALEWLCFYFVLNETSSFCNNNYPIHSYDKDSNLRVISFYVQQPLLQRATLCFHFWQPLVVIAKRKP